jgi:hypothetical protein
MDTEYIGFSRQDYYIKVQVLLVRLLQDEFMKIAGHDLRKNQFSYFLGKVVTILTNASNVTFNITDQKGAYLHYKTYGGICEGFDEYGVWLFDPQDGVKSFFFFGSIHGIIENPQKDADDPLVKQALERAEQEEKARSVPERIVLQEGDGITESMGEMTIDQLNKMIQESQKL